MLVGRRRELRGLAAAIAEGRGAFLIGEAGIGKSTLLRAAAAATERRVFTGECLSGLSWYTYLPICRATGDEPPPGDAVHVAGWLVAKVDDGLLLIDDLQWADAETIGLLEFLAGRIDVVAAIRSGDPGTGAAVAACEAMGLGCVAVGPVGRRDAREIVRAARTDLAAGTVERIVDEATGNPLLLEELAHGNGLRTLRLGLRARLHRCSPAARRTMALLGALGRPTEPRLAGPGVAELRAAGLLAAGALASPRHALLGEIALADIPERERRRIHAELAALVTDPGEAARHHLAAGDPVAAHRAALVAARSSDRPGDRARHLELAATAAPDRTSDALRVEAADALVRVRMFSSAEALLRRVMSSKRDLRARVHLLLARCRADQALDDVWERELRDGLELVAGTGAPVETELLIELVERPVWACDADEAVARAETALRSAERSATALARAHAKLAQALYLEEPERCRSQLGIAFEYARRDGDGDSEMLVRFLRVMVTDLVGQSLGSIAQIDDLVARAEELGLGAWAVDGRYLLLGYRYAADGPTPELAQLYAEVLTGFPPLIARDQAVYEYAQILGDLGREEEARAFLARAPAVASGWGAALRTVLESELHWLAGRPDAAEAAARDLADRTGLFGAEELARCVRGLALLDLGRPVPAPGAGRPLINRFTGPLERGLHALSTGDALLARELFDEAALVAEGWSARDVLRARWLAGKAARLAGENEVARSRFGELERELSTREMRPLLDRVRRSLRLAGARPIDRARRHAAGLTARELDVLELVGDGLSSREVAARMGLSRSTVESHVRSARTKLGVRTRLEAAVTVRKP